MIPPVLPKGSPPCSGANAGSTICQPASVLHLFIFAFSLDFLRKYPRFFGEVVPKCCFLRKTGPFSGQTFELQTFLRLESLDLEKPKPNHIRPADMALDRQKRRSWRETNLFPASIFSFYSGLPQAKKLKIIKICMRQDDIISRYRMTEMRTGEVAPDTFLITFVELGRFRKKSMADVRTRLEWICYLFNNPGEMGRVLEAADDDFIRDFTRACNVAGFTPQKKIQYESTMMNEMDYRAIIQYQRKEGEKEKAISIARKMLEMDMDVNTIATATGLTPQAIEELKNSDPSEDGTELQV